MKNRRVLLVNPWITDFAAYDLWTKPLGLLYIGKFLREYGYELDLIDLTDRLRWGPYNRDGSVSDRGKYHKTIIPKPKILAHVQRRFGLYGATPRQFRTALLEIEPPLAMLITSHMSYWYPGIIATIKILREYFPAAKIVLGGIYATLFPKHAISIIKPDILISGYGEKRTLQYLDEIAGIHRNYSSIPDSNDSGALPWNLYPALETAGILTSRGCPLNCDYCATKFLNPLFRQRSVNDVTEEIIELCEKYNATNIAFYDDALLINKEKHIVPILKKLIAKDSGLQFHTPNGMFAKDIDAELAEQMVAAGFKTIRLSLESIVPSIQKTSSNKVSTTQFEQALERLENAGFRRENLEAYLIMGLPGQQYSDVEQSIRYVAAQGAISRLASYSPIPHTRYWEISRQLGYVHDSIDPLLTNNTIYPCANENFPVEKFTELRQISNSLNSKVRSNTWE